MLTGAAHRNLLKLVISVLALLAYGDGLGAMDRGDYATAAASFGRAIEIDPGFQAARARSQEASSLQQASGTSGTEIAAAAASELTAAPATESALVDQIIPDINRSGADDLAGNTRQGDEIAAQESSEDPIIPSTRVPIVIENPNPQ